MMDGEGQAIDSRRLGSAAKRAVCDENVSEVRS